MSQGNQINPPEPIEQYEHDYDLTEVEDIEEMEAERARGIMDL